MLTKPNLSALWWISLVLLGLFAARCTPSSDISSESAKAHLQLSTTDLTYAAGGGEEIVTVSSTQEWSYFTNVTDGGWLTCIQDGDQLHVKVDANPSGTPRHATIIVTSGVEQRKLTLSQQAVDFAITVSEDEISLSYKSSTRILSILGSTQPWTLESVTEPWLRVHGKNSGALLVIEVDENDSYEVREAILILKSYTGEQRGITVVQRGIDKYYLPFDAHQPYSSAALLNFENHRDNILVRHTEPAIAQREAVDGITLYLTPSKYTQQILYEREYGDISYSYASMLLVYEEPQATTHPEYEGYIDFLREAGYTIPKESSSGNTEILVREDEEMMVTILKRAYDVIFTFEPLYVQKEEYPTFSSLPIGAPGFMDMLDKEHIKVPEVRAYEAGLGSKLYKEAYEQNGPRLSNLMYTTGWTGTSEAQRGYWFYRLDLVDGQPHPYDQSVVELSLYYDDPTLGIWTAGTRVYITNEFEALLKAEGYRYIRFNNGAFVYGKTWDDQLIKVCYIQKSRYSNILDGRPALIVGYFYQTKPDGWEDEEQTVSTSTPNRYGIPRQSDLLFAPLGQSPALDLNTDVHEPQFTPQAR